jgi:CelD/BcsL family acetyltransferase involved in cellulose biosynthesis
MSVLFSDDGRDFVRRDWSTLVKADPSATIFSTPDYLKLYWEEFGEDLELLLAFVERAGAQVGVAVFEGVGTTIRFLGGTEVTDYLGPVAAPADQEFVATELIRGLSERGGWEELDLRGLAEDQPWLELLRRAASDAGLAVEVTDDREPVAPFLPLPGAWEEYLASLPSKLRHEIKRKARKLESELGSYAIVESTEETLQPDLDRFVELHRSSEGPKGKFMQPGMEIFFRRLGETFLPEHVFHLTFLEVEGEKLAGTIGFLFEGTFSLYNSAFDHDQRGLSPGMVLVGEDIRLAIEHGCSAFDMLKGDYEYKYRFGAYRRAIKRLVIRPG